MVRCECTRRVYVRQLELQREIVTDRGREGEIEGRESERGTYVFYHVPWVSNSFVGVNLCCRCNYCQLYDMVPAGVLRSTF